MRPTAAKLLKDGLPAGERRHIAPSARSSRVEVGRSPIDAAKYRGFPRAASFDSYFSAQSTIKAANLRLLNLLLSIVA